jgi:hypothetical protein
MPKRPPHFRSRTRRLSHRSTFRPVHAKGNARLGSMEHPTVSQNTTYHDALDQWLSTPPTFWQQITQAPKVKLGTLLFCLLSLAVFILLGFTPFVLPSLLWMPSTTGGVFTYFAQLPFALGMALLLGPILTRVCLVLGLLLSLLIPVLPQGTCVQYWQIPSVGYPLWDGAVYWSVVMLTLWGLGTRQLHFNKVGIGIIIGAVLTITILVSLSTILMSWQGWLPVSSVWPLLLHKAMAPLGYHLVFSVLALALVKPLRALLYLFLY